MTAEEFNAAIATKEGKEKVAEIVAELFPHLPKSREKKELPNE